MPGVREEEKREMSLVHPGQINSHSPTVRYQRRKECAYRTDYLSQAGQRLLTSSPLKEGPVTTGQFFDNKDQRKLPSAESKAFAYLIRSPDSNKDIVSVSVSAAPNPGNLKHSDSIRHEIVPSLGTQPIKANIASSLWRFGIYHNIASLHW